MMKPKIGFPHSWLNLAAASAVLLAALPFHAQNEPGNKPPETTAPRELPAGPDQAVPAIAAPAKPPTAAVAAQTEPAAIPPDRTSAYFHLGLADIYEEEAADQGRPELATQAIEEYKLALNADPGSALLNDGLAELYLRSGRAREAEATARAPAPELPQRH